MENKKTTKVVKKVAKTAAKKTTRNTPKKETKKQKKKGFTLIELLAVIIILGILMIIAIPSVTSYISDSRKNAYVDTAKEIVSGTRNVVNEGNLGMYDTNTTFYIPAKYVNTENSLKSPYGEFTETSAYVGVIYDGKGYKYYWISSDDTGQGIPEVTPEGKLDTDDIESDLNPSDILTTVEKTGIGNRSKIKILNMDGTWRPIQLSDTSNNIPEEGGDIVCKPATELNKVICNISSTSMGCGEKIGYGNEMTYGTLVSGTPKAGDAYDCKVTKDGGYTERFYYIKSEGANTILIYNKNMNNQATYAYDSNNQNWYGPRSAYLPLPDTSVWDNPYIIAPGARAITTKDGATSTPGGTLPGTDSSHPKFEYTGKAARLLTASELASACSSLSTIGKYAYGELDGCIWLMENIGQFETGTGATGYWLETPNAVNNNFVWVVYSKKRYVPNNDAQGDRFYGVRPVITVPTANISK